jgi:hypothetical protein
VKSLWKNHYPNKGVANGKQGVGDTKGKGKDRHTILLATAYGRGGKMNMDKRLRDLASSKYQYNKIRKENRLREQRKLEEAANASRLEIKRLYDLYHPEASND